MDNPKSLDYINEYPQYLVPNELRRVLDIEKCRELGKRIKEFYFGDKEPSLETLSQFIDLVTDKWLNENFDLYSNDSHVLFIGSGMVFIVQYYLV